MKLAVLWPMVAKRAGMRGRKAEKLTERIVRALGHTVVKATAAGERVSLPGWGVFRGRPRKGREFDLPQGGHHVIGPHLVLTFRAAESVRVLRRGP